MTIKLLTKEIRANTQLIGANMNKFILPVIQFLEDPKSITKEELKVNAAAADAAADADYAADAADAAAIAAAADAAAYAAYAADAYAADAAAAEKWLVKYFEYAGESRQDYIDVINKGK